MKTPIYATPAVKRLSLSSCSQRDTEQIEPFVSVKHTSLGPLSSTLLHNLPQASFSQIT